MHVRRVDLADAPTAAWDRFAAASFFASRGFVELWAHAGGEPCAWLAEEAGATAALLPGVEYGAGPLRRFASLPDGCYGGVLVDPALAGERPRLAAALLDAVARRGYAKAAVFDYYATLPRRADFDEGREATLVTEFGGPDWHPPDAKLRSQIRRAAREGLRAETFSWARHGGGFLALVRASAARHRQRPRHPAALYAALARLAARDPRVRWYWCERDGVPVASHLYFLEGGAVQAWQSHFDRRFSRLKPNQFLRFTACRDALALGAHRLNLGSTPPGARGLAYYKARWGGTRVHYASWIRWHGLGRLARALAVSGSPGAAPVAVREPGVAPATAR